MSKNVRYGTPSFLSFVAKIKVIPLYSTGMYHLHFSKYTEQGSRFVDPDSMGAWGSRSVSYSVDPDAISAQSINPDAD